MKKEESNTQILVEDEDFDLNSNSKAQPYLTMFIDLKSAFSAYLI